MAQETEARKAFYRADVDGLRAVAVLAVLGFHYWVTRFPGGFVGVDIFFVISGYLLSAIIVSGVKSGRFTFAGFYERRIRRIFPALFVLLAFTTLVSCIFLWPRELLSYNRSMIAASLSSSNFYFWATSNYFDAAAGEKPLLHTWSLAVEEQFYVVFPVFIALVYRYFPRRLRAVVAGVTLASLLWSIVDVRLDQTAAFYLPFTRMWELLFGAMITLRTFPLPQARWLRELLAASGLLGIAAAIFLYSAITPFPGEASLLPCLGAGLIILVGQDSPTLTSRLLSLRPIVFIGLISYSLYLWHWPLLVFFTWLVLLPGQVAGIHSILAVASFVIATLSWRFVESPFRTGPRRPGKRAVYAFGAGCVVTFATIAACISSAHGLPGRFPAAANSVANYLQYGDSFPSDSDKVFRPACFLAMRESVSDFDQRLCLGPINGKRQVLLFGDSHAADLQYGLEQAVPGVHFSQATVAGCHPTLGQARNPECKQFVATIFDQVIPRQSISLVALDADWNSGELQNLTETIAYLHRHGVRVILFGPRPEYTNALPRLIAESIVKNDPQLPHRYLNPRTPPLDAQMSRLARDTWHVPYISLFTMLCPENRCVEFAAPGVPLQFDFSHFTLQGSAYAAREVNKQFPGIFVAH